MMFFFGSRLNLSGCIFKTSSDLCGGEQAWCQQAGNEITALMVSLFPFLPFCPPPPLSPCHPHPGDCSLGVFTAMGSRVFTAMGSVPSVYVVPLWVTDFCREPQGFSPCSPDKGNPIMKDFTELYGLGEAFLSICHFTSSLDLPVPKRTIPGRSLCWGVNVGCD